MTYAVVGPGGRRAPPVPVERPLQLVVLGLLALLAYVLRPVAAAIVAGGFIVLVARQPFEWLVARVGNRLKLAAWIATTMVVLLLILPTGVIGYLTVREAGAGIGWLEDQLRAIGGFAALNEYIPSSLKTLVPNISVRLAEEAARLGAYAASQAPALLSSLGILAAQAFLTVVTAYYLFQQGPEFVDFVRRISPLRPSHTEALLAEFNDVAQGLFWGNVVTAVFHGIIGAIGYAIIGVPKLFFLGVLTMFASFIPGLGTAIVWLPIAIALGVTGHPWKALFLLAWGFAVIGAIDSIARPLVAKARMKLPDLLVFLTIFGGIMIFGLKGLLLGPLVGSLAVTGLRLVARDRGRTRAAAGAGGETPTTGQ